MLINVLVPQSTVYTALLLHYLVALHPSHISHRLFHTIQPLRMFEIVSDKKEKCLSFIDGVGYLIALAPVAGYLLGACFILYL